MAETILHKLSLEQKVSLLAGKSYWRTSSIQEHGVKAIKVSRDSFDERILLTVQVQ
jgi:hypothetical protein